MPTRGKGSAFDNPAAPPRAYTHSMQVEAQRLAALSDRDRDERERAILTMIDSALGAGATRKRFFDDTRGALRRARDGPGATSCSNWTLRCPKCKSGRVGEQHHIFCDVRETFQTKLEMDLAAQLKKEIGGC